MTSSPCLTSDSPTIRPWAPWPLRWLASVKLAVVLIVVLATVAAVATFVEVAKGRDYVLWYVYHSPWFAGLLGVLAVNVVAATIVRFPWKMGQIPFLATHVGLLVLLAGAAWTFRDGIEGRLVLGEGEAADRMELSDRCQFKAEWTGGQGRPDRWPAAFAFSPGPVDRREGEPLDLGQGSGVHLKLTRFYRHAERHEDWVADDSGKSPSALKLAVADAGAGHPGAPGTPGRGSADEGRWLVANPFRPEVTMDHIRLEFQRAPAASMQEDFLKPPEEDMDPRGVLSLHYAGRVRRIPVGANIGKKIDLGDGKVSVEIVQYLPNAKVDANRHLGSEGNAPANPLLELRIRVPDQKEPIRKLAFAHYPFQNFEELHGPTCPVKFCYHHPACKAPAGVEFLETPDGKLYCRVGSGGKYQSRGEVHAGDELELPAGAGLLGTPGKAVLMAYLPHARRQVTFQPAAGNEEEVAGSPATACLEVTAGGETQEVWLQQNDKEYGTRRLATPDGPLAIAFGNAYYPLGFSLRLEEFEHSLNPGGMGHASFASKVRVIDKSRQTDRAPSTDGRREIWTNHPLAYGKFVFYQSGFREEPGAKPASVFMVAHDPGRGLKYLGSLMTCVGTLLVLCRKAGGRRRDREKGRGGEGEKGTMAESPHLPLSLSPFLPFLMVLSVSAAGMAARTSEEGMDWKPWRSLPVQDRGRRKPLDTLATETLGRIGNRTSFTDPETGRTLDATGLYLSLLFDYEGQDANKWDLEPLILVKSLELRKALNMADGQTYISAHDLREAEIEEPHAHGKLTLMAMAQQLSSRMTPPTASMDKAVLDVAGRLAIYEEHRSGRKLEIAPLPNSENEQWVSVLRLMLTRFDDNNDPGGRLRQVKEKFQQARDAYVAGDPQAFHQATVDLLATLRDVGPELGDYPSQSAMDLEVAYNHWAPFRVAWVLMLVACLGVLLSMVAARKWAYVGAVAVFLGGVAAMLVGFGMRMAIAGRAPVTNMYESVLSVGLGTAVFGLIFTVVYRKRMILAAAAAISTLALLLAIAFDPSVQPLMPVLRSNYWLAIHVITVMASYAAFALAWIIGNSALGFYLARSKDEATMDALARVTYWTLFAGVLLLETGTVLGAMWADDAWGRFWSWDRKEVWALITLLIYLAVLHARCVGWVGNRGLAALSAVGFALVLMAWYGVNFMGAGSLHSYGFTGGGGQAYLAGVLCSVQFLYVGLAVWPRGRGAD